MAAQQAFLSEHQQDPSRFTCPVYHTAHMTREACAVRWWRARTPMAFKSDTHPGAGDMGCRTCRIGAAHAGVPYTAPPIGHSMTYQKWQREKLGLPHNPKGHDYRKATGACKTPGCKGKINPKRNKSGLCSQCSRKASNAHFNAIAKARRAALKEATCQSP